MNSLDVSDLLRVHLTNSWDISEVPVQFLNEDFDKPNNSPWMTFIVKPNETLGQTIGPKGDRKFKRMGVILFQVFIPLYSSSYVGMNLCERVIGLFEGERIGGVVWCYKSNYSPTGTSGDFYQFNGSVYYRFEETK